MGLEIAATAIRSSYFQFTEGQAMGISLEQFYISSDDRLHQLERIGTWCSWVSLHIVNDHKHVWPQQHFPSLQWKFNPDYFVLSLFMGGVTNQQVPVISRDSLDQGSSNIYGEQKTSLHQTENGVIRWMQLIGSQDSAKKHNLPWNGEHLLCLTNSQWKNWIYRKEYAENGFNMILYFHSYLLINGVQPKTMRKWANTSLTLWLYYM